MILNKYSLFVIISLYECMCVYEFLVIVYNICIYKFSLQSQMIAFCKRSLTQNKENDEIYIFPMSKDNALLTYQRSISAISAKCNTVLR